MTTYAELIAYAPIALYAQNRDLALALPDIVARAQRSVVRRLDHDAFRDELVTTADQDGDVDTAPFLALGDAMMELRSVFARRPTETRWRPLFRRNWDMLETLYGSAGSGFPRHYAERDDGWQVYPRPGQTISIRASFNMEPPVLSPTAPENVLSTRFFEVMQAATVRECAVYMLDANAIQLYGQEVEAQTTAANAQIARRRRDETGMRGVETTNAGGS